MLICKMKKRITLKHIAGKFDVSIATVSKALNDSYEISVKTKEKLQNHYFSSLYYNQPKIVPALCLLGGDLISL